MIGQNNFSIGLLHISPQIVWPYCAHDIIVDKVHRSSFLLLHDEVPMLSWLLCQNDITCRRCFILVLMFAVFATWNKWIMNVRANTSKYVVAM